jgi:hypothetical protein
MHGRGQKSGALKPRRLLRQDKAQLQRVGILGPNRFEERHPLLLVARHGTQKDVLDKDQLLAERGVETQLERDALLQARDVVGAYAVVGLGFERLLARELQ